MKRHFIQLTGMSVVAAALMTAAVFTPRTSHPTIPRIVGTFTLIPADLEQLKAKGYAIEKAPTFTVEASGRFTFNRMPDCVFDGQRHELMNGSGQLSGVLPNNAKLSFDEPRPCGVISTQGGFSFRGDSDRVRLIVDCTDNKRNGVLTYQKQ